MKIKMKLCFFLIIVLMVSQAAFSADLGDTDNNGSINIIDALLIAQYYVDMQPNPWYIEAADVDGDDEVDIVDALLVAQYYVGLINEFPGATTTDPTQAPYITPVPTSSVSDDDFIIGADISWVQQNEDNGKTFSDNGIQKDILEILKDHKFNWIRLRLFHNPDAYPDGYTYNTYNQTTSGSGYCGLENTIRFAKRVKAAGLKFLLDFHYSDTWADPSNQHKPSAWEGLSFTQLEQAVYDYTRDVITQCRDQGVLPDMVQVGNEINPGFIHPDGSSSNWTQFGALLRAGVAGVRDVDQSILIMLHTATGGDNSETRWFMDNAISLGVYFDVMGLSCYPDWHGPPSDWRNNLNDLASRYDKRFVIAEYSEYKEEANDIVNDLPNGKGMGTFIWEPTRWHEAIFNSDGSTNSRIDVYLQIATQAGL